MGCALNVEVNSVHLLLPLWQAGLRLNAEVNSVHLLAAAMAGVGCA